ncbi:MAG: protease inhibitor I42 family protein [Proteobacteria bacterium]|nr:protease inhibitor I42 family protein [Pseudomonadota bacterium]
MEASSEIELRAGGAHSLVLGSTGSTGYVWEFEIIGQPDVIRISENINNIQSDTIRPQNYSVEHTYVIEALGPGRAEAHFVFRRPWEKDAPPVQVKSVRVNVIK